MPPVSKSQGSAKVPPAPSSQEPVSASTKLTDETTVPGARCGGHSWTLRVHQEREWKVRSGEMHALWMRVCHCSAVHNDPDRAGDPSL